jgi:ketosteroid isomerase-like protein
MSQENVELVRERNEHFVATLEVEDDWFEPDVVWDMSTFTGWPEKQEYLGVNGYRQFFSDWLEAWDDLRVELVDVRDCGGDRVVSVFRQFGKSKHAGLAVSMNFGIVRTLRDARYVRVQGYATPEEALEAAGLSE